jgi:hypothetical protein
MSNLRSVLVIIIAAGACQPARAPAPQHPAIAATAPSRGPGRADVDPTAIRAQPLDELVTTGHEHCAQPPSPLDDAPQPMPIYGEPAPLRREYFATAPPRCSDTGPIPVRRF